MTRRALVTGITGFIGGALARRLLADGWRVDAIVRPHSDTGELPADVTFHRVEDGQDLTATVAAARPDVVFHLASLYLAEHRSDQVAALVGSNILFPALLAEAMAAAGVRRLVNTGTAWQQFRGEGYLPVNLYAATKQAAEDLLLYYADARDLSVVTLRLFDTYGRGDKRRKLIQILIDAALSGERLDMSPGEQIVDMTHVEDVAAAFVLAAERLMAMPGRLNDRFYVSGQRQSVRVLAEIVAKTLGRPIGARFGGRPYRTREVMAPHAPTEAERLPGWSPSRTIETCLPDPDRLIPMPSLSLFKHRDLVAGVAAQGLQYGAALLLLPLIATRLSSAEIGVWFVFVTIQALSALIDFGFQPNIARAFAAAFAGAPELLREGISHTTAGAPNLVLAKQILASARRLYLILAGVALLLLLTVGTVYLSSLVRGESLAPGATRIAWFVFAIGVGINLYLLWAAPLLMGAGRIHQNYLSVIIIKGSFAILGAGALLAGGGLIALAVANLLSVLLGAAFLFVVLRPLLAELRNVRAPATDGILRSLWYNSSRTGLVLVGGFLINRANVLLFSTFVGLGESARYAFTLQVLSAALAIAQLPTMIVVPRMTALRVQNAVGELARLFLVRHAILLVLFVLAAGAIGVIGPWGLRAIGSRIALLPPREYILFSVVLLLELNSINCGYLLSTGNRVPFVNSALISGAGVVVLSLIAVWLGWGVLGALAAQGLVQLAYNNWKWPLEAWKDLRRWI